MSFTFRFSTACTFRSTVDDSGLIRFLPKAGVDAKGTKDDPGGEFSFFFNKMFVPNFDRPPSPRSGAAVDSDLTVVFSKRKKKFKNEQRRLAD